MARGRDGRARAAAAKVRTELQGLSARGVLMEGNATSSVLLVKGEPGEAEIAGNSTLSGADGTALKAALLALGYAPEEWLALAGWLADGSPLVGTLARETIATLDPSTLVACDEAAANLVREAYAEDLSSLEDLDDALLVPGHVAHACGMRVLNLGGFEAALASPREKQVMWSRLKRIPPLGEPY